MKRGPAGRLLSLLIHPLVIGLLVVPGSGVLAGPAVSVSKTAQPTRLLGLRPARKAVAELPMTTLITPSAFDTLQADLQAIGAQSGAQVGISLLHFTRDQWNEGEHISRSQLAPGDLVFFFQDIGHVGMYVGNGMMVDAPTFGQPVQVQTGTGDAQCEGGQPLLVEGLDLLVGEHHLEQGRPAGIGDPLESMDEEAEGEVLMLQTLGDDAAGAAQKFVERGVADEVAAHRQEVDEIADQPLESRAGSPGDRGRHPRRLCARPPSLYVCW